MTISFKIIKINVFDFRLQSCPVGSYFDPVLLICVKAEDASCS